MEAEPSNVVIPCGLMLPQPDAFSKDCALEEIRSQNLSDMVRETFWYQRMKVHEPKTYSWEMIVSLWDHLKDLAKITTSTLFKMLTLKEMFVWKKTTIL